MTIVIQVGNSDDKLTQKEWCEFVTEIDVLFRFHKIPIHFHGFAIPNSPWQNVCWVLELENPGEIVYKELVRIRKKWKQKSIAITTGQTEFI